MLFKNSMPNSARDIRHAIYQGSIFKLPANGASNALIQNINNLLRQRFNFDLSRIHDQMDNDNFLEILSEVRKEIEGVNYLKQMNQILSSTDFEPTDYALDYLRLRCVKHDMHKNPHARSAYTAHRDTWFANPSSQINWWIPLHNIQEEQSFKFYPDLFDKKVCNNSAQFDFNRIKKNGWQTTKKHSTPAVYPEALDQAELKNPVKFICNAGDIILFSAAHLHQTNENTSGLSRFSLDFRSVHLDDFNNDIGAPDIDNLSKPDAFHDYLLPADRGLS